MKSTNPRIAIGIDPSIQNTRELMYQTAECIKDSVYTSGSVNTNDICDRFLARFFSEVVQVEDEDTKKKIGDILKKGMHKIEKNFQKDHQFEQYRLGAICSGIVKFCNKIFDYLFNRDDLSKFGQRSSMDMQDLGIQLTCKTFEALYKEDKNKAKDFISAEALIPRTPQEDSWIKNSIKNTVKDKDERKDFLGAYGSRGRMTTILDALSTPFMALEKLFYGKSGPGSKFLPDDHKEVAKHGESLKNHVKHASKLTSIAVISSPRSPSPSK
jgi:hypothetical protein